MKNMRGKSEGLKRPGHECFTAIPSGDRARILHISYKEKVKQHFLEAFTIAADGLGIDLSHIQERFHHLDPCKKFSPAVYVALTNLTEALRSGNVTRVMDSLQEIRVMPEEVFFDGRFRFESVLTEGWEKSFVETARNENIETVEKDSMILRPILEPVISTKLKEAYQALEFLKEVDPELAAEFREYITRVKLFIGRGYLGFSSPAAFGAIYMKVPDKNPLEFFLEHLVHELSHLHLNAIIAHDPLLENPKDLDKAPLREDPRPLFQILQATFVLGRNVRIGRRLVDSHRNLGYESELKRFEEKFSLGYDVLKEKGKYTEMGNRFFESLGNIS